MNWKQIDKKYPKAIDKFFDWMKIDTQEEIDDYAKTCSFPKENEIKTRLNRFIEDCLMAYEDYSWNERGLYDFFDEQGIWVTISQSSDEECRTLYNTWEYIIEWLEERIINKEFYRSTK